MLCPICGLLSYSTSVVCPHHVSVIYDSEGKVIDYMDWKGKELSYQMLGYRRISDVLGRLEYQTIP